MEWPALASSSADRLRSISPAVWITGLERQFLCIRRGRRLLSKLAHKDTVSGLLTVQVPRDSSWERSGVSGPSDRNRMV